MLVNKHIFYLQSFVVCVVMLIIHFRQNSKLLPLVLQGKMRGLEVSDREGQVSTPSWTKPGSKVSQFSSGLTCILITMIYYPQHKGTMLTLNKVNSVKCLCETLESIEGIDAQLTRILISFFFFLYIYL